MKKDSILVKIPTLRNICNYRIQMDRDRQRFKIITGSGAQRAFVRMVKMACDFAKCRTVVFKSKVS